MFAETLRQALMAILNNAMRSFLTVLGVIIGVAAVIAMVTVGKGSTARIETDVATLGTNMLILLPGAGMGPQSAGRSAPRFTMRDVEAIRAQIPGVTAVAPSGSTSLTAVYGNQNHRTALTGVDNDFLAAREWTVALGRTFYESELRSGAPACILGETVRRELFGSGNPEGESVRLGQISCRIVGVLEAKGASSFGQDQDDLVLIPIRTFMRRIAGNQEVSAIYVGVARSYSTERAKGAIELLLRERRRVGAGEDDDFSVMDTKELTTMLTGITAVLTGLLSAVAAVSLLVGGIGIMNIMLVSVTERTREIGIRLAIGATEGQVLLQFLVEAVVLSLLGGLIGIIIGLALGYAGSLAMRVPFSPDAATTAGAFAFSALIGIIFGYFPARRAARLDPIEALRHE